MKKFKLKFEVHSLGGVWKSPHDEFACSTFELTLNSDSMNASDVAQKIKECIVANFGEYFGGLLTDCIGESQELKGVSDNE